IKDRKRVCLDLETTSLRTLDAEILGIALAVEGFHACYIPVGHDYDGVIEQLNLDDVLDKLEPILSNKNIEVIGQNLKYDLEVLAQYKIIVANPKFDTMLESYVIDSVSSRHDMDSLAKIYLNEETTSYEDLVGKGAKQMPFSEVDIARATNYAAEDADVTLRLHEILYPKLQEQEKLNWVFENIEMPLMPVLMDMELTGVKIDKTKLNRQSKEIEKKLEELESQAFTLAGEEFNLGSPKQLGYILYEKLELPVVQKTPKG